MTISDKFTHKMEDLEQTNLVAGFSESGNAPRTITSWFDDLMLPQKFRLIFGTFGAALLAVCVIASIGFNQNIERQKTSKQIEGAALETVALHSIIGETRYNAVRFLFGTEPASFENTQETLSQAKASIAKIQKTTDTHLPNLSSDVVEVKAGIKSYQNKFAELQASQQRNGDNEATAALAYELSNQGDTIIRQSDVLHEKLSEEVMAFRQEANSSFYYFATLVAGILTFSIAVLILGSKFFTRGYTDKITELTYGINQLASGSSEFHIDGAQRHDEIGKMLQAMFMLKNTNIKMKKWAQERANKAEQELEKQAERERERADQIHRKETVLSELANQFERNVGEVVTGVASASSQLQDTASKMAETADESSRQTSEVASSMEKANAGATSAAAASDEFAMSIGEISRQAASSAQLARKATGTANEADLTISALSDSAEQVGQIVELIHTIAQRTNLLALNASIEAARGGESGRGFAVVASEVKELAMQTSRATDQVSDQIRAMQDKTGASVSALRSIAEQVQQLESTSVSIATAVDQQSVAGQDLARSIDLAARSSERVSNNIENVRSLSLSTGAAASQVLSSSTDLEDQATKLRHQAQEFLNKIRSI